MLASTVLQPFERTKVFFFYCRTLEHLARYGVQRASVIDGEYKSFVSIAIQVQPGKKLFIILGRPKCSC